MSVATCNMDCGGKDYEMAVVWSGRMGNIVQSR